MAPITESSVWSLADRGVVPPPEVEITVSWSTTD